MITLKLEPDEVSIISYSLGYTQGGMFKSVNDDPAKVDTKFVSVAGAVMRKINEQADTQQKGQ
jgi:hypothetical protein